MRALLLLLPPLISLSHVSLDSQRDQSSSLIVCGVDGSVYTLSAWDGSLKGKFMSGGAVVSSSTMAERLRRRDGGGEDSSSSWEGGGGDTSLIEPPSQPTIVPGLDGLIYTLSPSGSLSLLPVSALDIVATPLATCSPTLLYDPITHAPLGPVRRRTNEPLLNTRRGATLKSILQYLQHAVSLRDGVSICGRSVTVIISYI